MTQGLLLSDWNSPMNQLVLVNARGKIFMVNAGWQNDDVQHGLKSPHCLDTNVADDWSLYEDMGAEKAAQVRVGITDVLAGKLEGFTVIYGEPQVSQSSLAITVRQVSQRTQGLLISRHIASVEQQDEAATN